MSHSLTPEFSSAQPRSKQMLAASPPSSPHLVPQSKPDDINTPFEVLNSDLVCEPYNTDQSSQPEFERGMFPEALNYIFPRIHSHNSLTLDLSRCRRSFTSNDERTCLVGGKTCVRSCPRKDVYHFRGSSSRESRTRARHVYPFHFGCARVTSRSTNVPSDTCANTSLFRINTSETCGIRCFRAVCFERPARLGPKSMWFTKNICDDFFRIRL